MDNHVQGRIHETFKTDRADIVWAALARNKKDANLRPYVNGINVNGRISCTDGKRLHIVDNVPMGDGFYTIGSLTKTKVELCGPESYDSYPNIDRVIPDMEEVKSTMEVGFGEYAVHFSTAYSQIIRKINSNFTINVDFLKGFTYDWKVYFFDTMDNDKSIKAIVLVQGNRTAVIIPMRVE